MVLAYHLIMTTYGFWLPNDPRGSWSAFVRAWELFRFSGPATSTQQRRSLARDPHDITRRLEAKKHLARNPVRLTGLQARAVARGFARFVQRSGLIVRACAVMPDHAHLVVMRHCYSIEKIAAFLKGAATTQLAREELHPFQHDSYDDGSLPTPWARKWWKVYLDSNTDIRRAVRYVENNPLKSGLVAQHWNFVAASHG